MRSFRSAPAQGSHRRTDEGRVRAARSSARTPARAPARAPASAPARTPAAAGSLAPGVLPVVSPRLTQRRQPTSVAVLLIGTFGAFLACLD